MINRAPRSPSISGPNSGKSGESYDFTFNAIDPNDDNLRFIIDWGDGKNDTTAFIASGVDVTLSHTWETKGTFTINAKAEDEYGLIGPVTTKIVTMPRSKQYINIPLIKIIQSQGKLFQILQILYQRLELL